MSGENFSEEDSDDEYSSIEEDDSESGQLEFSVLCNHSPFEALYSVE